MRGLATILMLTAPVALGAQASIQMGVTVRPESVTVGDPFLVQVLVRAPTGSTIRFPAGPDSGSVVELLDPPVETRVGDTTAAAPTLEMVARYRMAAWDIGTFPIELGDARVVTPDGVSRPVPLGDLEVIVTSVLPADTTLHIPKPARQIFGPAALWWWPWLPLLLAAALLGALFWWWRRRRRRGAGVEAAPDPYDLAEREFARIEALGLLEAGERGRFVALMVEVLRDYLAARVAVAHPSLTSTELIDVMRAASGLPVERLAPVLGETDMIKFARRPVSTERARAIAHEARSIVHEMGRATPPGSEREAA